MHHGHGFQAKIAAASAAGGWQKQWLAASQLHLYRPGQGANQAVNVKTAQKKDKADRCGNQEKQPQKMKPFWPTSVKEADNGALKSNASRP